MELKKRRERRKSMQKIVKPTCTLMAFGLGLGVLLAPNFIKAEGVNLKPAGMSVIGSGGTSSYSRKVETSLGIYTKNGTIPGVTQKDINYAGVRVHILEVDAFDKNGTFVQVDYAGKDSDDKPKHMNNFYDKDLTANDEYYWVGAINAGFFNNSSNSSMYGYPTGAVKQNGQEAVYNSSGTNYEDIKCSPAYGNGFVTLHLNKNDDMKLIYNGWKNGNFYKYAYDSSPNSWDYGEYDNWQDAVSGAYTLKVDGNNTTWGKGDYTSVDYWTYDKAVTLFGQKSNGNFVMVTTDSTLTGNDQQALMTYLDVVDAIRFDGGGSTQMVFDKGLVVDYYYTNLPESAITEGEDFTGDDIAFDVYMKNGTYQYAKMADIPQAEYWFTDPATGEFIDIRGAAPGTYNLYTEFNGLQQISKITVEEWKPDHTVTFIGKDGEILGTYGVSTGGTAVAPENIPEIEGYEFVGWDKSLKDIKEDQNITAQYEPIAYKLTLDYDGGFVETENPQTYTIEDTITINNPVKPGYKFIGWSQEGSQELIQELVITKGTMGDLTYKANYEQTAYTITYQFDALNVINDENPISYEYGQEIILKDPIAKGYEFVGWYLNEDILPDSIISSDTFGDLNLYGEFKLINYMVGFDDPKVEDIEFTVEDLPLQLPIPENTEELRFEGWYFDSSFTQEPITQITDIGSIDLYGKWISNTPEIISISVEDKVDMFKVGQLLSNEMFTVMATNSKGETFEIVDFTIAPMEGLKEGENVVQFSYKGITVEHTVVAVKDDTNPQGDKQIELTGTKASAYTITLPKSVDVSQETTEFSVKVKGDIAGDEKLVVSIEDTQLLPVNNNGKAIPVIAKFATTEGNIKSYGFIHTDILNEAVKEIALTHDPLPSGQYQGELSVNVSLQNLSKK